MSMLVVKNLTKRYPSFVLEKVSFSLAPGRIMGLIGVNGAGKTTTLKAIMNMICPDDGEIAILGRHFRRDEAAIKKELGVVLGGVDYYHQKRLRDITSVTSRFYADWDDNVYRHYMQDFHLDHSKKINELSSGMKVKYALTLALSHNARLLILDEPTSGLDPVSRDDLLHLFIKLVKDGERSILFSTHIISDLEKCADDITYIKGGKVLASAEKDEFITLYQNMLGQESISTLGLEDIMLLIERQDLR